MSEFERVPVSLHTFFQEGPGLRNWQWSSKGIKAINGTNIRDGGFFDPSNTDKFVSIEEFDAKYNHFAIDAGDIVVSSSGTLGKVARVGPEHLPMMMNTSVIRFRSAEPKKLDDGFLYAWLRSPDFQDQVEAYAHGAAQRNFGPSHIKLMTMALPPIEQQRRIASIVAGYDDLIEVNRRQVAVLEAIARGLFKEWFVRFRFPGHESHKITDTPDGPLPEGWVWGTAADLVDFDPRTSVPADGEKPFIPMGCLNTTTSLIAGVEVRSGNSGAKFKNDDTLFARITPCLENGKTGVVRDLPSSGVGFGSTEFIVMRAARAGAAFAYCLARYDGFRRNAEAGMSGASGRQRAPTAKVGSFAMGLPANGTDLFERFEAAAWPMLDLVGELGKANAVLADARDLLLPRLISGELPAAAVERELEAAA